MVGREKQVLRIKRRDMLLSVTEQDIPKRFAITGDVPVRIFLIRMLCGRSMVMIVRAAFVVEECSLLTMMVMGHKGMGQ